MEPQHSEYVCPYGHDNPLGGKFCNHCGAALVSPNAIRNSEPMVVVSACQICGGDGSRLEAAKKVCSGCRWLRPLAPGYHIDAAAFQWAQDGSAMATLRSSGPLNSAARSISDGFGRRWIETTLNGVRLGPNQMPHIYDQAVLAAQILGMPSMPDVYISGVRMWDALTYGSDRSSFVVLGTALITNFRGEELLFLLAREMGHCRAGHALWKTVLQFLIGEQGPRKGVMSGGVLSALNPFNLIEGAVEMPLLAWARQAEITADRAGLLAIGEESVARRTLLSWSLKSSILYRQVNIDAWLHQEEESGDDVLKISEMMLSPTPYIARRIKLMAEFARSPGLRRWRDLIARQLPKTTRTGEPPAVFRFVCPTCKSGMRVPASVLEGKNVLRIRCPGKSCGKVATIKKKASQAALQQNVLNSTFDS